MKTTLSLRHLSQSALFAVTAAIVAVTMVFGVYVVAEPAITYGQDDTATFFIRQTINDETSFLVDPANVTMNGAIAGLTGGNATGTSQFVVISNNAAGYYVNIRFFDNVGTQSMRGDVDGSDAIRDYLGDVGGEPSFNFTTNTAAQFAYTVAASTTGDIDQSFKHNGTDTCNTGSNTTAEFCWKAPSTTDFRIISRASASATGATSTVQFRVHVPSSANPALTGQTYTATATLSLFAF
jgi:hypothetical protein